MLINADDLFERRHEMLQAKVRFATRLAGVQTECLAAHLSDAEALDLNGPRVMRAACLFAYALQKFGVVARPEHAPLVVRLARLAHAKSRAEPEVMAVRWILGRARLAEAAAMDLPLYAQRALTERALNCFSHVHEAELDHPILLPGILNEYPDELLVDRHPFDVDPPVQKIHPPYRYQTATAAALIRLEPQRAHYHRANVEHTAGILIQTHPDASLAQLNVAISVAAATALDRREALTTHDREIGYRLINRINASVRDCGLSKRKWREWLACSHAMNAIFADTEDDAFAEVAQMVTHLRTLFTESYRTSLPDFARVDAVYRCAFDRLPSKQPVDYGEFLRRLMPSV